MAAHDAVLAGGFTLLGAALQQAFTIITSHLNEKRTVRRETRNDLRVIFGQEIAQARRIQRILKESSSRPDHYSQEDISAELDRLSEINAELRLIASDDAISAVIALEDEMRRRINSEDLWSAGPLPLSPVIETLRRDLNKLGS